MKIIGKYSPEIIEEYDVRLQYSENPHFDYILRMIKRKGLIPPVKQITSNQKHRATKH